MYDFEYPFYIYRNNNNHRKGGGDAHRFRLDDCVLIKENHIKLVGDVARAIRRARDVSFSKEVEVKENSPEDAKLGTPIKTTAQFSSSISII